MTKINSVAPLFLFLLLISPVLVEAQNAGVVLDQVFPASPVVEVLGAEYSVHILGESRSNCAVRVSAHEPERVHLLQAEDRIRIRIESPPLGVVRQPGVGTVEVRVPTATDVVVQTAAGPVFVGGLTSPRGVDVRSASGTITIRDVVTEEIYASTASGDLAVRDIQARLTFRSAGGAVRLLNAEGRFSLRTASGDQRIENVTGILTATSASGSIRLANTSGSYRVSTSAGAILANEISVGADSRFETVSGPITLIIATPASALQILSRSVHAEVAIGGETGSDLVVGSGETILATKSTTGAQTIEWIGEEP